MTGRFLGPVLLGLLVGALLAACDGVVQPSPSIPSALPSLTAEPSPTPSVIAPESASVAASPSTSPEPSLALETPDETDPRTVSVDVAPEVAELMAVTQRPIAASALEDKATKAAWKTIPSWTLVSTQDLAIPAQSMRFMAERAGSTTVEVDASHAVYVSQPRVVADLIVDAARATTGADLATAAA